MGTVAKAESEPACSHTPTASHAHVHIQIASHQFELNDCSVPPTVQDFLSD